MHVWRSECWSTKIVGWILIKCELDNTPLDATPRPTFKFLIISNEIIADASGSHITVPLKCGNHGNSNIRDVMTSSAISYCYRVHHSCSQRSQHSARQEANTGTGTLCTEVRTALHSVSPHDVASAEARRCRLFQNTKTVSEALPAPLQWLARWCLSPERRWPGHPLTTHLHLATRLRRSGVIASTSGSAKGQLHLYCNL